jgi:FAD synthetase
VHCELVGDARRPAVVAVGTWDPLSRSRRALLQTMASHAAERDMAPVVVVLDPPPPVLANGPHEHPDYSDVGARIAAIRALGLSVVRLTMTPADLDEGAQELLEALATVIAVRELWLGRRQSFGRGVRGAQDTLRALARDRGIHVHTLTDPAAIHGNVQELLSEGRIAEAAHIVGTAPVRSVPASRRLVTHWRAGAYRARPTRSPGAAPEAAGVKLDFYPQEDGSVAAEWSGPATPFVTVVAGPADLGGEAPVRD